MALGEAGDRHSWMDRPEGTGSLPSGVQKSSGMDAFTQAVESYMSTGATWWSDAQSLQGAKMVIDNLLHIAQDRDAPDEHYLALLQGSYMAGLALSHSRLGLVHGLAHPLGYRYHAAHGLVCGVCLPAVLKFNREAASAKYDALSSFLGEDALAMTENALQALIKEQGFFVRSAADHQGKEHCSPFRPNQHWRCGAACWTFPDVQPACEQRHQKSCRFHIYFLFLLREIFNPQKLQ